MPFASYGKRDQSASVSEVGVVTAFTKYSVELLADVHPNTELSCAFVKAHIAPQLEDRVYEVLQDHSVRISLDKKDHSVPVIVNERNQFQWYNRITDNRYDHLKKGEASILFHRAILTRYSEFYGLCTEFNENQCQMRSRYYSSFGFTDRLSHTKDVQMFNRKQFSDILSGGNHFIFSMKISNKKIPMTCLKDQN